MDITSLYYFHELCKDLNVTKTATRLFISQQTLSNHIIRTETEFQTKLFYRKPHLALTDSGREMLLFAKKVLEERAQFTNKLTDIEKEQRGLIRFGASHLCSRSCLPSVLPRMAEIYPDVSISLTDKTSESLQQLTLDGELDMAISVIKDKSTAIVSQLIMEEKVYLCVSDKLLQAHFGSKTNELKKKALQGAYVKDFKDLPFSVVAPPNILGNTISRCFEEAGFFPQVYFSSTTTGITSSICSNGLSACFLSQMSIANSPDALSPNVNIFPLKCNGNFVYHNRYLIHHARHYLTKYMLVFQDLIKDYFTGISQTDLSRLAK